MRLEGIRHSIKRKKTYNSGLNASEKVKIDGIMDASNNALAKKIYEYNKKMDDLLVEAQMMNLNESKGRSLWLLTLEIS